MFRESHDVVTNALDSGIIVSEFELQSRSSVQFRTNTLRKGMNPLTTPSYGLNSTSPVLFYTDGMSFK